MRIIHWHRVKDNDMEVRDGGNKNRQLRREDCPWRAPREREQEDGKGQERALTWRAPNREPITMEPHCTGRREQGFYLPWQLVAVKTIWEMRSDPPEKGKKGKLVREG